MREYVIIALILAVITYVEFAIIEYEIPWLSSGAILWLLMAMSVVKFVMVIMYFMHLKDDDATYTGFFSAGMLMALGTFVAFAFMMTAPASISYFRANNAPEVEATAAHADEGLDEETAALIESDGASRAPADQMDSARPADGSLQVEPPAAPEGDFTLAEAPVPGEAGADGGGPGDAAPAAADVGEWDQALGEEAYGANCASCHQPNGQGIPGAFPPLAGGHMPSLVAAEGGREYVIDAVLYGLQGPIEVQGQSYAGVMPAWQQLSDEEIAAILNHEIIGWDNAGALPEGFEPIAAQEVADARGQDLSPTQVHEERPDPVTTPTDGPSAGAEDAAEADPPAVGGEPEQAVEEAPTAPDDVQADGDAAAGEWDQALGEQVYGANCASCHQPNGQGIPGAFPPLAGHAAEVASVEGGREYLVNAVLYGLQGPIEVQGQSYAGVMPAWQQLGDDEVAAVVNHVVHFDGAGGDVAPVAADEVAALRDQGLSAQDVHALREELALP